MNETKNWYSLLGVMVKVFVTLLVAAFSLQVALIISEITDKGSLGICSSNGWLELFNSGADSVDIESFICHDDNGINDPNAFTFQNQQIAPQEYLLVCTQIDENSPQFGIGGDDTVTL